MPSLDKRGLAPSGIKPKPSIVQPRGACPFLTTVPPFMSLFADVSDLFPLRKGSRYAKGRKHNASSRQYRIRRLASPRLLRYFLEPQRLFSCYFPPVILFSESEENYRSPIQSVCRHGVPAADNWLLPIASHAAGHPLRTSHCRRMPTHRRSWHLRRSP